MQCEHRQARRVGRRPRVAGVTLVELMVTTGIVAILAAIAYPSYQRYVSRTHRNSAAACLAQYSQLMERHYTSNLSYLGGDALSPPGCRLENNMNRYYTFAFTIPADGRTYTVRADPSTVQQATDALQCGTLTLNQSGARTPTNNACW
ncbi:type IV pilin protein [Steroidobacter sp.]|uniref:type IV pilin protein n=1 Tax=Steroidobacter sp. TaxID=1978227 RepID=UPI001A5413E5|nr:type IV pilin protein [Steroidobacter sp.]MBL8265209.1 type IV pilin protein [Steroidobacter sp.]